MTALTPEQMRALASLTPGNKLLYATEIAAALEFAADQLDAVRAEVIRYAGWHEQSPEDSWRFERDIRTALGMEQYSGDDDD